MTREEYKAELMRILDQHPGMDIQMLARRIGRVESWVAELVFEARRERYAELWTCLVE